MLVITVERDESVYLHTSDGWIKVTIGPDGQRRRVAITAPPAVTILTEKRFKAWRPTDGPLPAGKPS